MQIHPVLHILVIGQLYKVLFWGCFFKSELINKQTEPHFLNYCTANILLITPTDQCVPYFIINAYRFSPHTTDIKFDWHSMIHIKLLIISKLRNYWRV